MDLEADRSEEVVADLGRDQGVGRRSRWAAGVVALDDVLDRAGLLGMLEDPREVDETLTGVAEAAGLVHVLDVVLRDPTLVLLDDVHWVARAPSDPEQVQLQVH